jgi:hypothetical protein
MEWTLASLVNEALAQGGRSTAEGAKDYLNSVEENRRRRHCVRIADLCVRFLTTPAVWPPTGTTWLTRGA